MTLSDQLDSLLFGWLEDRAEQGPPLRPDARGTVILSVKNRLVPEIEAFCRRWDLGVRVKPTATWSVIANLSRMLTSPPGRGR